MLIFFISIIVKILVMVDVGSIYHRRLLLLIMGYFFICGRMKERNNSFSYTYRRTETISWPIFLLESWSSISVQSVFAVKRDLHKLWASLLGPQGDFSSSISCSRMGYITLRIFALSQVDLDPNIWLHSPNSIGLVWSLM